MHVEAASVKNLDKLRASGTHYASYKSYPVVVGFDGVGKLEDGTPVYAQGITGMIAEKALIAANGYTVLPDGLDAAVAAALPNAVIGAALAIRCRAGIKKGDVVLVNGATGVTGQFAVQVARHYGASKIIATGRNPELLKKLEGSGVEIISLRQDEGEIIHSIKEIHARTPIDLVIDYLWGQPISMILAALKGNGMFTHKVKIVTVGSMAGEHIQLGSGVLRSSDIEILGSGIGSLSREEMGQFRTEILPEMFRLAMDGILNIEIETAELKDISAAWERPTDPGRRLVITI